ncbi:MAG: hypothetical protein L3J52_01430 [Proteobacteria bacterium]|nr:hypothetical protein [Pseudomonadota bacterium]
MKKIIPVLLMFSASLMADTTLTFSSDSGKEVSKMHLTKGKMQMTSLDNQDTGVIFDASSNSFVMIDHKGKTYTAIGPKEIEALSNIGNSIEKMIDKQLESMPAAQREQMRGMISNMIKQQMPKPETPSELEKTGQSKTYNGYKCDVYEKSKAGKKTGQFCVTDYRNLGISSGEYASIASFMQIAEKLGSQFGQDNSMNFSKYGDLVPVRFEMNNEYGTLTDV